MCKQQFVNVKTFRLCSLLQFLCACTVIRDRTCCCSLEVAGTEDCLQESERCEDEVHCVSEEGIGL